MHNFRLRQSDNQNSSSTRESNDSAKLVSGCAEPRMEVEGRD